MSEEQKKNRNIDDIQKEYTGACVRAGHLQYQISQLKKDLSMLNETMLNLNLEGAAAQAQMAKEQLAKQQEAAPKTEPKEEQTNV